MNQPVSHLLGVLGLGEFVPVLERNFVDMAALRLLNEKHLMDMGLPIGAVVKLKAALTARSSSG